MEKTYWFRNQLDEGDFKMLKREHIEYEIRKIKKDIYDIEQEIFTCFTELQDRLDALNKYVRSTYGLGDSDEKDS